MSIDVAELERPVSSVPAGWAQATLGDIISLEYGKSLPDKSRRPGHVPVYGSNGVVGWHDEPLVATGGIIVGRKGTAGSVTVSADPFWPIDTTYFVKPRQKVDWEWLAATLHHSRLKELNEATGVPGLNRDKAYLQPILLPPLDEQWRIAVVLRSVDEAIAVADVVEADAVKALTRIRDALILEPSYERATLAEATAKGLFTDGDWVESKDQDPDGEVRLIQLADVGDGSFIDKSKRYLTMEKAHQLRCTFLREGDLLLARMPDPLGRCCLFPLLEQPCVTVVDVCVIRAGPLTSNRYLAHALATSEFRQQVLACASGTTRTRVSRGNLGRLEFPMPTLQEQEAIVDVLDQLQVVANRQKSASDNLRTVKHSLMSDLLSGRVRVPA